MSNARVCVSCEHELPVREFRGARFKAQACVACEASHPERRWCIDCAEWLPEGDFYRIGPKQRFQTNRCKPCRVLFSHGVTKADMVELTGNLTPACGACGDGGRLHIDHDHAHCPGERGCRSCVRGYLCRPCNTAEGLLRTPERAVALADYMKATRFSEEQLAQMPTGRAAAPRVRTYAGASRKFYEHP